MTNRKKHFTLMEMLVVIAIIGLLAALAFPVVGRVREKSRETDAAAGANNISLALKQYKAAYQKFPSVDTSAPVGGGDGSAASGYGSLNDYDKIIFILSGVLPGGGAARFFRRRRSPFRREDIRLRSPRRL